MQLAADAAQCLAEMAEGSARDAISLLDQLTAYCTGEITLAAVRELYQLADTGYTARVLDLLTAGDNAGLLGVWHEMLAQGVDAGRFLLAVAGEAKDRFLETRQENYRNVLDALWQGANLLKLESFPTLLVELTLLEAQAAWHKAPIAPGNVAQQQQSAVTQRLTEPSRGQPPPPAAPPAPPAAPPAPPAPKRQAATDPGATNAQPAPPPRPPLTRQVMPQGPAEPEEPAWVKFLTEVKRQRLTTYSHVFNCAQAMATGGVLQITMRQDQRLSHGALQKPENARVLQAAAALAYGPDFGVALALEGQPASRVLLGTAASASSVREADPPAELLAELVDELSEDAQLPGATDPVLMQSAEEELYAGLKSAETPDAQAADQAKPKRLVTALEAMNLFEGVEIEDEE